MTETNPAGPFVQAALFCERVLEEKDGVVSAMRVMDITTIASPAHEGGGPPPLIIQATALIMIKPGRSVGRYAIELRPEAPSGMALPPFKAPVTFQGGDGDRGVNIILPLQMQAEEGLYWFDVLWVDDKADGAQLLTRIPLRVVWQPMAEL